DHILLGVSDLDQGIAWMEERSGVRAVFGGVHPGRGTRNALLSLGPRRYLEIIAPDPAQKVISSSVRSRRGQLEGLASPRLVAWAVHTDDVDALVNKARAAGIKMESPHEGGRTRPDGRVLRWRVAGFSDDHDGLLPFFIEWNRDSLHPSE